MGPRSYRLVLARRTCSPQLVFAMVAANRNDRPCPARPAVRVIALGATIAIRALSDEPRPRYAWPVTRPLPRDPLANTTRLLVDGTNLLHAMRTRPGRRQPPAAVIGRLRGVIPPDTAIELVFDGPTESGVRGERIAGGLTVRYSGRRTADAVILELVDDARRRGRTRTGRGAAMVLVVTDDRDLRARLHRKGARTAGAQWLIGRMERPSCRRRRSATPARRRRRTSSRSRPHEERRWTPGRGATTKRGNPRRTARTARRTGPSNRG